MTRKNTRNRAAWMSILAAILAIIVLAALPCRSAAQASGSPLWAQQAELTPSDTGGFFGRSVAIDGETAVAGAPSETFGANYSQGAAYIYVNNGGVWTQQSELVAADGASGDNFGWSVAISGNLVVIGASGRAVNGSVNQGTAYLFYNNGGTWSQIAELTASDGAESDNFGWSVSVNVETVIVGAPGKTINGNAQQGAAYVFANVGGAWTQLTELTANDGLAGDEFGLSVSGDATNAIVGAPYKSFNSNYAQGIAYVFTQNSGTWSQYAEFIAPDGNVGGGFGYSVSLSGTTAVIGAPNGLGSTPAVGSVYIYGLYFGTWSNTVEMIASDSTSGNWFGESVSLDSTAGRLAVGAPLATLNSDASGVAYAFALVGGTWTQQAELQGSDSASSDMYGNSVAVSGTTMVVGAPHHQGTSTFGEAYAVGEAAAQLQIAQQPSAGTVGSAIGNVIVQLEDSTGNALSNTGAAVTIASTPAGVSGTLTINAVNGVAVFSDLTFSAANSYTLTVTSPGLTPATSASILVSPLTQTINFGALPNQVLNAPQFMVNPTATSGLPVSVASFTTTVCSVSGNTVILLAVGQCTIQATQAGNAEYAAATPVSQSFQVTPIPNLKSQKITFAAIADKKMGVAPFAVTATASSKLPVTFSSLTASVCSISTNVVTLISAGTCSIEANQYGNAVYFQANPVTQSFTVSQRAQTIDFPAITQNFVPDPVAVNVDATSKLKVTLVSKTKAICTVVSGTHYIDLHATGTCTLIASQAGDAEYAAATPVTQSFVVGRGDQTITFPPIPDQILPVGGKTARLPLTATSNSGLVVDFKSLTPTVCGIALNTTTGAEAAVLISTGKCIIEAYQLGSANYAKAVPVDQSFIITQ